VSSFGGWITRVGLPLTAVIALHARPTEVGRLAAVSAAPALVVGLLAGGLVDRTRRRPLLIFADIARAVLLLGVPVLALTHQLHMAELLVVAAAVAGLSVLFDMADHAYLPALVSPPQLMEANSRMGATESVAEIGGPALAGALVSALTAPMAIALNAVTYLVSAGILLAITTREPAPPVRAIAGDWRSDIGDGFKLATGDPRIRPLFLAASSSGLFGAFFLALYIVFAIDQLGLTPAMLGLTIAVGGVGSLIGAALASSFGARLGLGPALIGAGALNALFSLFVPLAAGAPLMAMLLLMAAQLFGDAAGTAWLIYAKTLRQSLLAPRVLGRVAGAFTAASGLAAIVGALVGGELGQWLGARPTLLIACVGLALAPAFCLASPLRRLRVMEPLEADRNAAG
jgi:predicted MFS family arabinose efflux permease